MLSPLTGNLSPLGRANKLSLDFTQKLINTYGFNEVWKLTDMTSGTTVPASVNANRNGTESGWTLQNTASPVTNDTGLAPSLDGVNDFGELFSSSFDSIFNKTEFTFLVFIKMRNVGVWTDASQSRVIFDLTSTDSALRLSKTNQSPARLRINLFLTGASYTNNDILNATHLSTTDWFMWAVSYKEGVNLRSNFNGVDIVTRSTPTGTWVNNPTNFTVGAFLGAATQFHNGYFAYIAYKNTETSQANLTAIYADRLT